MAPTTVFTMNRAYQVFGWIFVFLMVGIASLFLVDAPDTFGGHLPRALALGIGGGFIAGGLIFALYFRLWTRRVAAVVGPEGLYIWDAMTAPIPWSQIQRLEIIDDRQVKKPSYEFIGFVLVLEAPGATAQLRSGPAKVLRKTGKVQISLMDIKAPHGAEIGAAMAAAIQPYHPVTVSLATQPLIRW
ncbi:MAG: hypothetical protein ACPGO3_11790 [Magnetospiraceae bacterium]